MRTSGLINFKKLWGVVNQNLPAGAATTGNPYLPGSQVTYTVRLENDGDDDVITDNTVSLEREIIYLSKGE